MTLNDLLRQGRSITEQLSSGDIPLIDAEGKEVNIRLALSQTKDDPVVCEIAFVRRGLDDMTQEELEDLKTLAHHYISSIRDNRLCGYIRGDELRDVINWLDKHNFGY